MDIASVGASMVLARQLQTTTQMQMVILKQLSESQQQISDMLLTLGIGSHIDLKV